MLIGEVAEAGGVTTKTLRFYERRGLLAEPDRTPAGYRRYRPEVVERVRFIRHAQAAGLTLAQIGEILEIHDHGEPPCEHVATLVDQRLAQVDERLRELRDVRTQLRRLADRAAALDPADCHGYCDAIDSHTS